MPKSNNKKFFPVIHVVDINSFYKNIQIAIQANVDGVFLISHGYLNYKSLINLGKKIKEELPGLWIGYNFLDIKPNLVFDTLNLLKFFPDGVWIDNSMVGLPGKDGELISMKKDLENYRKNGFNGLYFGGVAFKYQKQPHDLTEACDLAPEFMDVVTTSGKGTGEAADLEKIKTMHNSCFVSNTPLAIASGIDISNVEGYLPYIDFFLVSTGISIDHKDLDLEKTKELSNKIKAYK